MSALVLQFPYKNDAGTLQRTFNLPFNKLDATAAPGVGDDDVDGYVAGSLWVDRTNDKVYICRENATGAALWSEIPGASSGDVTGPASSVDEELAVYNGTTGKIIKGTSNVVAPGGSYGELRATDAVSYLLLQATNTGAGVIIRPNAAQDDTGTIFIADYGAVSVQLGSDSHVVPFHFHGGSGGFRFGVKAAAMAADFTLTLPTGAPSSNGQALVSTTGGTGSWASFAAVVGSSTDNAIVRFDGTGGAQQNSTVTLDDTGAMTFPEMTAPSTPASGKVAFYCKSDGKAYIKDDAGTETDLTSTGSGTPCYASPCGYRPTTESGVPVPKSDRTSQGTVYLAKADNGGLYLLIPNSGATDFTVYSPADSSLSWTMSGSAGDIKDLYVWDDAGTPTAALSPAWASATSRGTGAGTAEQDTLKGVVVNKVAIGSMGAKRGIYVGTVRLSGTNVTEQSRTGVPKWYVWSPYNQVEIELTRIESADSWGSGSASTWRAANANAANCVEYVCGYSVVVFAHSYFCQAHNASYVVAAPGVGIDSTSANSAQVFGGLGTPGYGANLAAEYGGYPGLGYHKITWLEVTNVGGGATTFYGDAGAAGDNQSGMKVRLMA